MVTVPETGRKGNASKTGARTYPIRKTGCQQVAGIRAGEAKAGPAGVVKDRIRLSLPPS